jgi:hypothetical protein
MHIRSLRGAGAALVLGMEREMRGLGLAGEGLERGERSG